MGRNALAFRPGPLRCLCHKWFQFDREGGEGRVSLHLAGGVGKEAGGAPRPLCGTRQVAGQQEEPHFHCEPWPCTGTVPPAPAPAGTHSPRLAVLAGLGGIGKSPLAMCKQTLPGAAGVNGTAVQPAATEQVACGYFIPHHDCSLPEGTHGQTDSWKEPQGPASCTGQPQHHSSPGGPANAAQGTGHCRSDQPEADGQTEQGPGAQLDREARRDSPAGPGLGWTWQHAASISPSL